MISIVANLGSMKNTMGNVLPVLFSDSKRREVLVGITCSKCNHSISPKTPRILLKTVIKSPGLQFQQYTLPPFIKDQDKVCFCLLSGISLFVVFIALMLPGTE